LKSSLPSVEGVSGKRDRQTIAVQARRESMTLRPFVTIAMLVTAASATSVATRVQAAEPHHTVVSGDSLKWGLAPPSLPPGAQAAILLGSPAKEGAFVIRLRFPAGYIVPPHRHSKDEFVTVISGRFTAAHGERVDRASLKFLTSGSFIHLPAGMPHYAVAEVESVVQINGVGPFDVLYVDPKDDPRLK
jgi:quercetin dioxygenase-like cupin family protein